MLDLCISRGGISEVLLILPQAVSSVKPLVTMSCNSSRFSSMRINPVLLQLTPEGRWMARRGKEAGMNKNIIEEVAHPIDANRPWPAREVLSHGGLSGLPGDELLMKS